MVFLGIIIELILVVLKFFVVKVFFLFVGKDFILFGLVVSNVFILIILFWIIWKVGELVLFVLFVVVMFL